MQKGDEGLPEVRLLGARRQGTQASSIRAIGWDIATRAEDVFFLPEMVEVQSKSQRDRVIPCGEHVRGGCQWLRGVAGRVKRAQAVKQRIRIRPGAASTLLTLCLDAFAPA
jgi:hypothetical protein